MGQVMTGLDIVTGRWTIDPVHSEIIFTIRHLMTTVRGSFTDFSGDIEIRPDVFDSRAAVQIAMASVDTRNGDRDSHVRSADFLDVAAYPRMTFVTTGMEPAAVGRRARQPRATVHGNLAIKNVVRPVELLTVFHGVGTDLDGGTRAGFTASTSILRGDYGIAFNLPLQGDRVLLGDQIDIQLEIQAVLAG
jgi:polyisoprenoid-binding protein YceI